MGDASEVKTIGVLFICIGNSCRSPMAESIFKSKVEKDSKLNCNWLIDSAALRSWNVGYDPEERCIKILGEHGLITNHVGRKITKEDFHNFDYIFGMDHMNMKELEELAPAGCKAKVELLGKYNPSNDKIILDPYFEHGDHGFRKAYEQISICCDSFLKSLS